MLVPLACVVAIALPAQASADASPAGGAKAAPGDALSKKSSRATTRTQTRGSGRRIR